MNWEPEDTAVVDPAAAVVRVCEDLCTTCIFRPGNLMRLEPGRVQGMVQNAIANEGHIVCHSTIGTDAPAICAGFARHPVGSARSLALRCARAGLLTTVSIKPPGKEGETGT